jgi:hypothetical protein
VLTAFFNWWKERQSVNSALKAEADRICEAIAGQLAFIRGDKGTVILDRAKDVPWLPFKTPVWDGLVDKLGSIGPKRAKAAAEFFGFFGFINDFLSMRGEYARLQKQDEFNERYIKLLEDQLGRKPNL